MSTAAAIWNKTGVLKRLMRIAEEAREATFTEKIDRNGECVREYDTKCAAIELKAVEYAVKISGLLDDDRGERIVVTLGQDISECAE